MIKRQSEWRRSRSKWVGSVCSANGIRGFIVKLQTVKVVGCRYKEPVGMPNHVENDLFIRGDTEALRRFRDGLVRDEEGKFSILESYYPMPQVLRAHCADQVVETQEELDAWLEKNGDMVSFVGIPMLRSQRETCMQEYGSDNWYDWAVANWGTKWGDYGARFVEGDDEEDLWYLFITFESAWSPPVQGLGEVALQFPELDFSMYSYEQGNAYIQGSEWTEGRLVESWSHRYHGNRGG
jgi:hypothetical protein